LRNVITGTETKLSGTRYLDLEGMSGMIFEIVHAQQ